jgi:hypothetical protein
MIQSGDKTEEYRDKSPYWNRIFSSYIKIKGKFYHPSDVVICFSNGYRKDRRQMFFQCEHLAHRIGLEEWGAVKGELYNVLILGKEIPRNEIDL